MDKKAILYLKIASFCVLIGRAYQFLFWDAPYRSLLWDQKLMEPIVNLFGYNWIEFANSLIVDQYIKGAIRVNGVLFLISALLVINLKHNSNKWIKYIIWLSGFSIVILSLLQTKEKFYHLAMFFEHAIQFSLPFLLLFFIKHKNTKKLITYLKLVIALAFACHGFYAIGYLYPLPANFVTMTLNILPISEESARIFLLIAGILDFLIAIAVFIPKVAKPILIYAVFWGFLTALARIVSGLTYDISLSIFHQYLYLTIYRLSHGLAPLLLYLLITRTNKQYILRK